MSNLHPLVSTKINDADVRFIVDSGAFYSMITPAAAAQLKLPVRNAPRSLRVEGVNGPANVKIARVERFILKKGALSNVEFLVGGNEPGAGAVGLLGQNILGSADVEYDLANGVIRVMYPNDDCEKADLAYWAGPKPVVKVEIEPPRGKFVDRTVSTAYVNGAKIDVMFDTGAPTSMLSLSAAKKAGLWPGGKGVVASGVTTGIGRGEVQTWIGPIQNFSLGDEQISNTRLRFGDIDLRDVDMLIGADFFLGHRMYVANSQGWLYFTYNGGPLFDLSTTQLQESPVTTKDEAMGVPPANESASATTDASGYARRGAASMSRRQFDSAVADLTRACELEPKIGRYFALRGNAWLALRQPFRAMSDFDHALSVDPADVDTRVARARLHLSGHDMASARADLLAADKGAADQADIRMALADLYVQMDLPDAALIQLDKWIAAHSQEVNLSEALNARCWARALLGIDLEKALADCNRAIESKPNAAEYFDSRGLVYLRTGDLDKALHDYDEALRINPNIAWSRYGRGVIYLRQGSVDAGNAEIAKAKAAQSSIEEDAKRHGLTR